MPTFTITITGLPQFQSRLLDAPGISTSVLETAVAASWAILAKHTTKDTVPWLTGFLTQTFSGQIEGLTAYWYPTASYARFVEFGTAPHRIEAKDAKALFWSGADHPVRSVQHPGTKANPYMERIVAASMDEINEVFGQALEQIVQAMAV